MKPSTRLTLPVWRSLYRDEQGRSQVFESQASSLTAHLALLANQLDYRPWITVEHKLLWETPDVS